MKKRILLVGLVLSIVGLSGCEKPIDLTEKEEDMVAEYIAGAVLNSQEGYKEKLISPTPVPTATPSPTPTLEASKPQGQVDDEGDSSAASNMQANADLTQVIDVKKVTAEYESWNIEKGYEEGGFNLEPQKGNVFVDIKFSLMNTSDHTIKINLSDKSIKYMLHINQKKKVYPSLTLLENDLQTVSCELKKGEKKEMVLVYEVSSKLKIDEMNLIAYTDAKTAIIKVK